MKSCPKCRREYIDQFNYCPIDGENLAAQNIERGREEKDTRFEIEKEEYDF